MNAEDANIANAERDADPVRWHDYDPTNTMESRYESLHSAQTRQQAEQSEAPIEETERESSISSSGSSVRDGSQSQSQRHRPSTVSRTSTRMEYDLMEYLDRHPTAIQRMQERKSLPPIDIMIPRD